MVKFVGTDFNVLQQYGYAYVISEGSWISADKATVISEDRSPYERQIKQYRVNMEESHEQNVVALINDGLATR